MEKKDSKSEALEALEQAWAYYMPEPAPATNERTPDLFEYANAA